MVKPTRQFLLEGNPNPEREGCPDEQTLRAMAEDRLPAQHPARLHLGCCSPCFAEFRSFKIEVDAKRAAQRKIVVWAIAACLLVAVGLYGFRMLFTVSGSAITENGERLSDQPVAAVDKTIDLFSHGTVRGGDQPSPLDAVSLPPSLVHLHLILPRFSDPGSYTIAVSKDEAGHDLLARGSGTAVANGPRLAVAVTLDLRGATDGSYFLSTVRESDDGTYYYPLKVQNR